MKITFPKLTSLKEQPINKGKVIRKKATRELIKILKEHFKSFNEDTLALMKWFNPENWTDKNTIRLTT